MQRRRLLGFLLFLFAAIAVSAPAHGTAYAADNQSVQEAAGGAYRIQPGDVMTIVVYGQPDLTLDILVLPDGTISYPFVGVLDVWNLTAAEVAERVTEVLSAVVRTPVVSVNVRPGKGPSVVVLGEVRMPGVYPVAGQTVDLLEAIALAGGTTPMADLAKVKVYQRGNVRDYKEAPIGAEGVLFEGEAAENPPVAVGNIVYVPPLDAEREIFVLGEVRNPGAYPLEPGREPRLLELIARAGGTTPSADLARVRIYDGGDIRDFREAPIGARGVLFEGEVADNPVVAVGHIVYVPPLEADPEIFVLGEVRNPGAYPVEPGRQPRLMELIARAGGTTPQADLARVKIYDGGDIRDFREAPIGTGDVLFEGEAAENPVVEVGNIVYVPRGVVQVTVMGLVARPGTLEVRAGERVLGVLAQAGGVLPEADPSGIILRRERPSGEAVTSVINIERILAGDEGAENPVVQPGDVIYVRPTIQVAVAGEVRTNGVFRLKSQSRVTDAILAAGGATENADLSRLTVTRSTLGGQEVIPVDFEAILAGRGENLLLQDGDIVNVPRTSRVVYVAGEVARPGAYPYLPGARLIDAVYQAGGPTLDADVDNVTLYAEHDQEVFSGSLYQNPLVEPGQTVYVPSKVMEVFVVGEASVTGRIRVPRDSRLLDVVAAIGGPEPHGNWRAVRVYRNHGEEPASYTVDVEALLREPASSENLRIVEGDVIYVPADVAAVSVIGEVARPGTYTLSGNTRLVDALAAAGGAGERAALERVNVLQSGERLQVNLGLYDRLDAEKVRESGVELEDGGVVVVPRSNRIRWQDVITFLTGVKLIKDLLED